MVDPESEVSMDARLQRQLEIAELNVGLAAVTSKMPIPTDAREGLVQGINGLVEACPEEVDLKEVLGSVAVALAGVKGGNEAAFLIRKWLFEPGAIGEVIFNSEKEDPLFLKSAGLPQIKWVSQALKTHESSRKIENLRMRQAINFSGDIFDFIHKKDSSIISQSKTPSKDESKHLSSFMALRAWIAGVDRGRLAEIYRLSRPTLVLRLSTEPLGEIADMDSGKVNEIFEKSCDNNDPLLIVIKPKVSLSLSIEG